VKWTEYDSHHPWVPVMDVLSPRPLAERKCGPVLIVPGDLVVGFHLLSGR
jgi:hypothetical protein